MSIFKLTRFHLKSYNKYNNNYVSTFISLPWGRKVVKAINPTLQDEQKTKF